MSNIDYNRSTKWLSVELVYSGYDKAHRIEVQLISMENNISKSLKGTGL